MSTPLAQPRAAVEPGAGVVVWGTWSLAVVLAMGLVGRFACPIPRWDDYDTLPAVMGTQPITIAWLLSPHNEHRVVLPRFVMLGLSWLFGPDARAAMVMSVVVLASSAAWLLRSLAKRPGGLRVTDALFPLLLLGLGQHANLLWAAPIQFSMATGLVVVLLGLAVRAGPGPLSGRLTLLAGVALTMLSVCGANGLAFVPAGGAWLLAEAFRTDRRRRIGLILAVLPGLVILILSVVFAPRSVAPGGPPPLGEVGRSFVQFTMIGLGTAADPGWLPLGFLVLIANVVALGALLHNVVRRPERRSAALGLACLLLGGFVLALAVAWGRAGAGPRAGLEDRYVTIALPLLVSPLVAFRIRLNETPARVMLSFVLMGVCTLFWPNAEDALAAGRTQSETYAAINRDLAAGMTDSQLLRRYVPYLNPSQEALAPMLPLLRRSGIGRLDLLRPDPPYRELPLGPMADRVRLARVEGDTYVITGVDPWLEYRLPTPSYVAGVRLRYDHESPRGEPARFVLTWRRLNQPTPPANQRVVAWTLPTGRDREVVFWIHDQVDEVAIQPDNGPCRFRVQSLELLIP